VRLTPFSLPLPISSSQCLFEWKLINNCHSSLPLHSTFFKRLCIKIGSSGFLIQHVAVYVRMAACACMSECVCACLQLDSYAKKLIFCQFCQHTVTLRHMCQWFPSFHLYHYPSFLLLLLLIPLLLLFLLFVAKHYLHYPELLNYLA